MDTVKICQDYFNLELPSSITILRLQNVVEKQGGHIEHSH